MTKLHKFWILFCCIILENTIILGHDGLIMENCGHNGHMNIYWYTTVTFCHMSCPSHSSTFHNPPIFTTHPATKTRTSSSSFATEPSMEPSICLSFTTGRNHHHRVHSSSTCLQRGVARANRHVLGKAKRGKRAKVTVSKPSTRQRSGSTLSQGIEPNSPAATVLSWSSSVLRGGCCQILRKET